MNLNFLLTITSSDRKSIETKVLQRSNFPMTQSKSEIHHNMRYLYLVVKKNGVLINSSGNNQNFKILPNSATLKEIIVYIFIQYDGCI